MKKGESLQTRLRIAAIAGLSAISVAHAGGSLEEAENSLAHAQAQYYQAIKAGKAQSPSEIKKLQEDMVNPAVGHVTQVIADREKEAIQKHVGVEKPAQAPQVAPEADHVYSPKEAEEITRMVEAENLNYGRGLPGADGQVSVGSKDAKVQAPSVKSAKPPVVIDGKQFPEAIEFKRGARGAAPAKRRVEPNVVPTSGGESSEIEFPGRR